MKKYVIINFLILSFILIAILLFTAIGALTLEYTRRSKNDAEKEEKEQERLLNIENKLNDLEISLINHSAQLLQLERLIQDRLSPPSKSTKFSSSTSTDKKQLGQALSVVDISSFQSPLIQLYSIDYLFLPITYAIQQTYKFTVSLLLKQCFSWKKTRH